MRLKGWEDVAVRAASAYVTGGGSEVAGAMGSGGDDGGGGGGIMPPSTATTVSPSFQQSFTPQVSPVIQVSQGGGTQTGSASQRVLESQQAKGGDSSAGYPGSGSEAYSPLETSPSFFDRQTTPNGFFGDEVSRETFRSKKEINYLPWLGGAVVIAGVAYFLTRNNTKPGAK